MPQRTLVPGLSKKCLLQKIQLFLPFLIEINLPLLLISAQPSIAEPDVPHSVRSAGTMETFEDRKGLRRIMYEYIEFVQHSKNKVKVDPADIAAHTPSKSLEGVTIAPLREKIA